MGADLTPWQEAIRTVRYGYAAPLYWIEMPDGKRNHMITRGKLMASLAVLRMNYADLILKQEGQLPLPKKRGRL
jgi:hypothetical protein